MTTERANFDIGTDQIELISVGVGSQPIFEFENRESFGMQTEN